MDIKCTFIINDDQYMKMMLFLKNAFQNLPITQTYTKLSTLALVFH